MFTSHTNFIPPTKRYCAQINSLHSREKAHTFLTENRSGIHFLLCQNSKVCYFGKIKWWNASYDSVENISQFSEQIHTHTPTWAHKTWILNEHSEFINLNHRVLINPTANWVPSCLNSFIVECSFDDFRLVAGHIGLNSPVCYS